MERFNNLGESVPVGGLGMNPSKIEVGVMTTIVIVVICLAVFGYVALKKLGSIEAKLKINNQEDWEHDDLIDQHVTNAAEGLRKRLDQIKTEKNELPQINLWAIDRNRNWEQDLITGAENLRHLITDLSRHPDSHVDWQAAKEVPMDYRLAHAWATLAHLQKDLAIKEVEWVIKKTELLGATRKREPSLSSIASDELELRDIERELEAMREELPAAQRDAWEAFRQARDKTWASKGGSD